ncbi:MAG: hypothetical protein AAFO04_12835 [Cyanobacteria bacterium J06592_8]
MNLSLPVTITATRKDRGLINIQKMNSETGEVEFSLAEEGDLTGSELTIRIQEDGTIFAY